MNVKAQNDEKAIRECFSSVEFRHSFGLRHSAFVILSCHSLGEKRFEVIEIKIVEERSENGSFGKRQFFRRKFGAARFGKRGNEIGRSDRDQFDFGKDPAKAAGGGQATQHPQRTISGVDESLFSGG